MFEKVILLRWSYSPNFNQHPLSLFFIKLMICYFKSSSQFNGFGNELVQQLFLPFLKFRLLYSVFLKIFIIKTNFSGPLRKGFIWNSFSSLSNFHPHIIFAHQRKLLAVLLFLTLWNSLSGFYFSHLKTFICWVHWRYKSYCCFIFNFWFIVYFINNIIHASLTL